MSKTYRYAAYGWVHPGNFAPTVLIGRYRTKLFARIGAWWFRIGEWDAHSWVKAQHAISFVENGKAV